jgi:hypothetical protein
MLQKYLRQRIKQLQKLNFVGAVKSPPLAREVSLRNPALNTIDTSGYLDSPEGTLG